MLVLSLCCLCFGRHTMLVSGRFILRQEIHNCNLCKRQRAQPCQQLMGNLSSDRITPSRPFSKVGMYLAGPFMTKPNLPRSKVRLKSFISVIVSMCTMAVHPEVVSDLSSQALLPALWRFISRRECPSDIYSENGKNLTGLVNQLKALFEILKSTLLQEYVANQLIRWHFIPPYSPNFG
ncbi:hypothetical protein AVEN_228546-1 [Araneus ventricosus]|uniref:Integrase catalytic domain-containing protein n=1 Tax=Araneus ventricosus TaxID=182803 RepID=A0A4Y2MVZ9_ARAVE|nr:hypothetical protein AVEN_228546-1 [Araneus ventricosus]